MISFKIEHTKDFMNKLLLQEAFDGFLVKEATISTFQTLHIDGSRNKSFYTTEELEELGTDMDFVKWSEIKALCFQSIKGKKTPLSFKFVFKLSEKNTEKFLLQTGVSFNTSDVSGLFLNISFENGIIHCVSGTALKIFTMEKALDTEWDSMVERFLKQIQVEYERL